MIQNRAYLFRIDLIEINHAITGLANSQLHIKTSIDSERLALGASQQHLTATSNRIEQYQHRIEDQLREILTNQNRQECPLMSHSLDASSPEGRQTWMMLGRLLREEGISPSMIKKHRDGLVNAMKSTIKQLATSDPDSFHTAHEFLATSSTDHITYASKDRDGLASPCESISILSSAPNREAFFPASFAEKRSLGTGSLNQQDNVEVGMETLFTGMQTVDYDDGTDMEIETVIGIEALI